MDIHTNSVFLSYTPTQTQPPADFSQDLFKPQDQWNFGKIDPENFLPVFAPLDPLKRGLFIHCCCAEQHLACGQAGRQRYKPKAFQSCIDSERRGTMLCALSRAYLSYSGTTHRAHIYPIQARRIVPLLYPLHPKTHKRYHRA